MANLQETSTWEAGIYQLETSDPVMGGENGIDNRAPRQLANRTLWLKNELARQIGAVNSGKLGKTENAVSATKLQTARNIAMTGDGSWNVNFDGLQNTTGTMTLAKSGVTAGSYNSVTVDAKGRVIRGLNQTHGLVTATTATGTANVATGNGNTFLNIVASGVGQTASVGSSTQVTGTNGISVSSDTAGKLILGQTLANNLTDTSTAKALTALQGKVLDEKIATINNILTSHRHNWNEIGGKPSTFAPSSHTHTIANITDYDVRQISTEDLDSITKWGIYGQGANNRSLTERNYPVPNEAGTLEVMPGTYGLRQRFTTYSTHRQFERSRNNAMTGWNAWIELSNTWEALRDKPNNLAYTSSNVATATKLQTARNIAMTGDGSWNVNFDGLQNTTGTMTLAKSGVTAGSYNSVTVDAKGRVIRGLNQTHGLVTATTATGTANVATGNGNTFLNIVASGVGQTASVGSSTQVTGTNGISVSSDTAGKLIVTRDSNSPTATKLATIRTLAITGDGTGQDSFDGSANANIALTLANSGVTAGSYNSVTVDAKGRVTRGLNQTHGLVTATTATGTANVATGNGNTFLNIVASGVGQTASVGSSTQVTGTNGITISSDTAGKLIVTRDSNSPTATKLQTACTISLTGAVTGRVNFDGSRNVSMATTLTKATVRDFNRIISGTATALGRTTNNIKMTGQVVVSADGLIRQYFHLKHFRDWWFGRDDNAIGYQNHDIATYKIPIALWTAMPNKVLSVQAQTMRSSDTASSAQFSSEAAEHEVAWAFRNQGIDKSNVWLNLSRTHGSASEHIDLFVIVEGY